MVIVSKLKTTQEMKDAFDEHFQKKKRKEREFNRVMKWNKLNQW